MSASVTPRRVLITGASGALGGACARLLAAQGWAVLLHAHRGIERAAALATGLRDAGACVATLHCDLTDAEATRTAIEYELAQAPIDALVHAAGTHADAPMAGMRAAQWHGVIDLGLHGFFHAAQPLLLPMARARHGRIVALGSVTARLGNRGQSNYAAAKAGLEGAVRSLAREMASRGVTVNVVAPGIIASPMSDAAFTPGQIQTLVPAQRAGTPGEVAALVAFLCSDSAAYINGQVIGVNGGMA
ncbi:MAG: 3-oxoacyl-ACP reductase FabG [Metallibacterium scheffleri]